MDTSDLAKRMKDYESTSKTRLMKRCPVMIRIDGKAFHSFTKGFKRPFDEVLIKSMQETTKYLCENIQGCVLGYTQSDEITLVLVDYKKLNTSPYFDYEIQKMCSIIASMTTMAFNSIFTNHIYTIMTNLHYGSQWDYDYLCQEYGFSKEDFKANSEFFNKHWTFYQKVKGTAMFDARVFNIPKEEVTNCLYWRQLDASRNSIQMVGQANFSHKELQNKSCNMIQDMLMTQKGINWNDLPTYQKRGSCVIREEYWVDKDGKEFPSILVYQGLGDDAIKRSRWIIDTEIPIFKGEGRDYIEKLINF